jgi:hypothetical protein
VSTPVNFTHAFAVPGRAAVIDLMHPNTGRSLHLDQTLEQVRERYPEAEVVALDEWRAARAAEQDAPVTWEPVAEADYDDALNVLPPVAWDGNTFGVGEPYDHHALSGLPRFIAYRRCGSLYCKSSRPMTVSEIRSTAKGML